AGLERGHGIVAILLGLDARFLEIVELGEVRLEIGVALALKAPLGRPTALWRPLAVHALDGLDHLHAVDDLTERWKAHRVEAAVVRIVDEQLSRARVRTGHGKGDHAPRVGLLARGIVLDAGVMPGAAYRGIAVDPELDHEALDHAEERDV